MVVTDEYKGKSEVVAVTWKMPKTFDTHSFLSLVYVRCISPKKKLKSKRNATSIALLNVTKLSKAAAKILNVS